MVVAVVAWAWADDFPSQTPGVSVSRSSGAEPHEVTHSCRLLPHLARPSAAEDLVEIFFKLRFFLGKGGLRVQAASTLA